MKKNFLILAVAGMLTGSVFTACNNQERKVENAAENVLEAEKDLNEAQAKFNEEWEQFKLEYQNQIQLNESDIATYREMEKADPLYKKKYRERIDELESRNLTLRERMNQYEKERRQEKWEEFKEEFKHDMNELGTAFKDFAKDNK